VDFFSKNKISTKSYVAKLANYVVDQEVGFEMIKKEDNVRMIETSHEFDLLSDVPVSVEYYFEHFSI
jgi:hypothetical protein